MGTKTKKLETLEKYQILQSAIHVFLNDLKMHGRKTTKHATFLRDGVKNYKFIPLKETDNIIETIHFVREKLGHERPLFCDAGAGYGFILQLARRIGFNVEGIELDKFLAKQLRKQIGENRVIEGNILNQDYSKYDVVYYYSPICDHLKEVEFEEKVEDELKVGGYILAANKYGNKINSDKRFKRLGKDWHKPRIYKKVKG